MNMYPEIKRVAELNREIEELVPIIEQQVDGEGLNWQRARFINGCKERDGNLYDLDDNLLNNYSGIVDDDYYCCQYTGYSCDDYYGTVYYKTDVEGLFVAVPFDM